jgi:dihydroxyacetone kinase-like protein
MSMASADEITTILATEILDDGPYTRLVREWDRNNGAWIEKRLTDEPFQRGDDVIALVNSMGGTPLSELYIVYRQLAHLCADRGVNIVRNLVGPYITSLEMQGCSITLVKADSEIIKFWDAPVKTPALRWGM